MRKTILAMMDHTVLLRCGAVSMGFAATVFTLGCSLTLSRNEAILYLIVTGILAVSGVAITAFGVYRMRRTAPNDDAADAPEQGGVDAKEVSGGDYRRVKEGHHEHQPGERHGQSHA